MKLRRRDGDPRIMARAVEASQLLRPARPDATEPSEQVTQTEPAEQTRGLLESDLVLAPEGTPPVEPAEPEGSLLLAGGFFRIRELYKPGTAKMKGGEPRQLRKGKD